VQAAAATGREASERASAHRLCAALLDPLSAWRISHTSQVQHSRTNKDAPGERDGGGARRKAERVRESPAAIFYWKMKWRFIVQAKIYITRASYLWAPFLDWSGAWGLFLRALLTLGSFGGYDQTSLCCFDTEPKGFAVVGSTVQYTQILLKR